MAGWSKLPIKDVTHKQVTRNPLKKPDEYFTYVDVSSVSNDSYKITGSTQVLGAEAPSRARKLINTDDTIFATVRPTLRRIALVPEELNDQICSTGYCVLKPDRNKVDPYYLYTSLLTDDALLYSQQKQKGATYPAINDGDLFDFEIPLPPLETQEAIARTLKAVQRAKEARETELALERERKAALMAYLFMHGTRGEALKQTEIGEMPKSWKVGVLGDLCTLGRGYAFKSKDYVQNGILNFRVTNIGKDGLPDLHDVAYLPEQFIEDYKKYLLDENDFMIVMVGATTGKIGKVTRDVLPALLNQNMWRFFVKGDANHSFLYHLVHTMPLSRQGAARDYLKQGDFLRIPVAIPKADEQKDIGQVLDKCDEVINSTQKQVSSLNELFHSMLDELMSGKLSVKPLLEPKKIVKKKVAA